jgi:hypothetical protein
LSTCPTAGLLAVPTRRENVTTPRRPAAARTAGGRASRTPRPAP